MSKSAHIPSIPLFQKGTWHVVSESGLCSNSQGRLFLLVETRYSVHEQMPEGGWRGG